MGRQRPVVRKPFMIIGGHNDSRDGEIIYQDCFYGELGPMTRNVFLPDPVTELDKVMDLGFLSRYGTPEIEQRESAYYEYEADCVARYGPGVSRSAIRQIIYGSDCTSFIKVLMNKPTQPTCQPAIQPHAKKHQVFYR